MLLVAGGIILAVLLLPVVLYALGLTITFGWAIALANGPEGWA